MRVLDECDQPPIAEDWSGSEERSAFGQGWEAHRNLQSIYTNPFPADHWKWEMFRDGYIQFKPNTGVKYGR